VGEFRGVDTGRALHKPDRVALLALDDRCPQRFSLVGGERGLAQVETQLLEGLAGAAHDESGRLGISGADHGRRRPAIAGVDATAGKGPEAAEETQNIVAAHEIDRGIVRPSENHARRLANLLHAFPDATGVSCELDRLAAAAYHRAALPPIEAP
jgi:hypothetical protein